MRDDPQQSGQSEDTAHLGDTARIVVEEEEQHACYHQKGVQVVPTVSEEVLGTDADDPQQ